MAQHGESLRFSIPSLPPSQRVRHLPYGRSGFPRFTPLDAGTASNLEYASYGFSFADGDHFSFRLFAKTESAGGRGGAIYPEVR